MLKLQVIGNLGHGARVSIHNGSQVINFSVAHNEKYKDKSGTQVDKTTWVDCTLWSESTVHKFLTAGTMVFVEGTPDVREYTARDGQKKYSLTLRAQRVELLKVNQPALNEAAPATPAPQPLEQENDNQPDDLPF